MRLSYKRLPLVSLMIIFSVFIFSRCLHIDTVNEMDPRGEAYAGPLSCITCHKEVAGNYFHTAHALTAQRASRETIKGPFNSEFLLDPGHKVLLQQRDSGLYQVAMIKGISKEARRFGIVIGSGRKAQTYLYWQGDAVYQLPVSYFVTEHSWANSPNYPSDSIWFSRSITTDCFECHASYVRNKPGLHTTDAFHQVDQFDSSTIVYGIDCERCHGPAAQHVAWQEEHPDTHEARYIRTYASLSRQQRLDACAVCHSGLHTEQHSLFGFQPGDSLSTYVYQDQVWNNDPGKMDVHGNQYQLLIKSKCYMDSKTLECNTCHNVHVTEREDWQVFARRCMTCHTSPRHSGIPTADTALLVSKCIDCHMPVKASEVITMKTTVGRDPVANLVRTHYIAIYPPPCAATH